MNVKLSLLRFILLWVIFLIYTKFLYKFPIPTIHFNSVFPTRLKAKPRQLEIYRHRSKLVKSFFAFSIINHLQFIVPREKPCTDNFYLIKKVHIYYSSFTLINWFRETLAYVADTPPPRLFMFFITYCNFTYYPPECILPHFYHGLYWLKKVFGQLCFIRNYVRH